MAVGFGFRLSSGTPEVSSPAQVSGTDKRYWRGTRIGHAFRRLTHGLALALGLLGASTGVAHAISTGCASVNAGVLNYNGGYTLVSAGTVLGAFFPGDRIFLTYTLTPAKSGVVVSLVALGGVTLASGVTGTNPTLSFQATIGQLLPINVTVAVVDLGILGPFPNVALNVTCTPAAAPSTLSVTSDTNPTLYGQTATLRATAAAQQGTPDGSVIFSIDGVAQTPVPLTAGVATLSTSTLVVGNHPVSASYAGNSNFLAANGSLSGGQTINKASTSTALTSSNSTPSYGSAVTFTATTTATAPGGGTPDGSVIFTIDNVDQAPVALSGGTASLVRADLSSTSHTISARYVPTSNYNASSGTLTGGVTVARATTSGTLTRTPNTTTFGQQVSFTAQFTSPGGTPDGSVVFSIDGVAQSPITLSGGSATLPLSNLSVGNHTVTAAYAGSTNFAPGTATLAGGHTVTVIPTTTTVTGPGAISFGQSAVITATIDAGGTTPTGTVVFTVDGVAQPAVSLSNGAASITLSALTAGSHTVRADYSGAATLGTSFGTLNQVLGKAQTTTTLTTGTNYTLGQTATVTAEVTSTASPLTGSVIFTVDGIDQPQVGLNAGKASLALPNLTLGNHTVSATYSGTDNFAVSTATLATGIAIGKATPSLVTTSSPNPSVLGQPTNFTATLTSIGGTPSGTVIFTVNGTDLPAATLNGSGTATVSGPALAVGNYPVTARYSGDTNFNSVTGALPGGQTVSKANTSLTVTSNNTSVPFGSSSMFTATVSPVAPGAGTPDGTVIFSIDGTAQPAATLNGSGIASITRAGLAVGTHTVTAAYAGTASFNPSSGTLSGGQAVVAAASTTTLTIAPTTASFGDSAVATATVGAANGTPAGAVIFTVNSVDSQPVSLVAGVASFTLPNLTVQTYTIGARYTGATGYTSSAAAAATLVVGKAATSVAVAAAPATIKQGNAVVLSATVGSLHGTPTGTVEFFNGGTSLGTGTLSGGIATLSTSSLPRGQLAISANYSGDTNFLTQTGTLSGGLAVTAGTSNLELTATPNPLTYGQTVTVTATASPAAGSLIPTGDVIFTVDGQAGAPIALNAGTAALPLTGLLPGAHTVSARYVGSADYLEATATLAGGISVNKAATTMALSAVTSGAEYGSNIIITANLTSAVGAIGGTVVFTVDGVAQMPVAVDAGVAVITLTGRSQGNHTVTASYSGDTLHLGATASLAGGVQLNPAATQITVAATPTTARFGDAVTFSATLTSAGGIPGGVAVFSIDGVAQGSSTLSNGTATLTTSGLTVGTHAITVNYAAQGNFAASSGALAAPFVVGSALTQTVVTGPTGAISVGQVARYQASVTAGALTPSGSVIFTIDGVSQTAVNLVNGVATIDFTHTTAGNHAISATYTGGASFAPSTGQLAGGQTIGKSGSTTTLSAAATSQFGQSVTATATVAPTTAGGTVTFLVDGTPSGSASLSNGSATLALTGLASTTHSIVARYDGDLNTLTSTSLPSTLVVGAAPTTLSATIAPATIRVGQTATVAINATIPSGSVSGPVTVTVNNQEFNGTITNGNASIAVTGVPAGTYPVTVSFGGTPNFGPASIILGTDLTVEAPVELEVTVTLPRAVQGQPLTGNAQAIGGTGVGYSYAFAGNPPPNLSIDPATGVISGTPTTAGTYSWTITATDSDENTGSVPATLTVLAPATITLPATLPATVIGTPYSQTILATGGTTPYVYAVVSGTLPSGLTLSTGGVLSGTTNQVAESNFTVQATDANGFVGSATYTVDVAAPTIVVSDDFGAPKVGAPYDVTLSATGGTAPYSFAIGSGSLPPGLMLTGSTITGTPTAAGTFDFTVLAQDVRGYTGTLAVELTVTATPIVVLPNTLAPARQNRPYSQSVAATGGSDPYTYEITDGALPTGLEIDPDSGLISGTPTVPNTYAFSVTATDSNGLAGTRNYGITVVPAATLVVTTALPIATAQQSYSHQIDVTGGSGTYTFVRISGALPPGLTLSASGQITGTPTATGAYGFALDISDGTDTVTSSFTLNVVAPTITVTPTTPPATFGAAYYGSVTATGGTGPYSFDVASGTLPAGISLNAVTGTLVGTASPAGTFNAVIRATDDNGFTGTAPVTFTIAPLTVVVAGTLPEAIRNLAYAANVTASGGTQPYIFTVTDGALPSGLTLATDGTISGTPTAIVTSSFTVAATDSSTPTAFVGSQSFALEVTTNLSSAVLPGSVPPGIAGVSYSASLAATGGNAPLTYATTGTLPTGISIAADGTLSGLTTQTGTFNFTLTVTDASQRTKSQDYALVIAAPTITADRELPDGMAGTAYSFTLTATGGVAPYTYSDPTSSLPAGVTLAADGTLGGTPTTAGTFPVAITVSDTNNFTATLTYTLTLTPPVILFTTNVPAGQVGASFSGSVTASGGFPDYTYAITAGTLPTGLTLNSATGALTGTPTMAEAQSVTVTATDAEGFTSAVTIELTIATNIGTADLPAGIDDGAVGQLYSDSVAVTTGGTSPFGYAITAGSLPTGLSFDTATGEITGTPTEAGNFSITITVTDAAGLINSATYTMTIAPPGASIGPATLPPATAGTLYTAQITASGVNAPISYALQNAPADLAIDPATGEISGIPVDAGSYAMTVVVTHDGGFQTAKPYTLVVARAAILLTLPQSVPTGVENSPYSVSLAASNAIGDVTYTSTGILPAGITLNPTTGELSGTPTAAGSFSFTVTATDAEGNTGSASLSLVITPYQPPVNLATTTTIAAPAALQVGQSATVSVSVASTNGPATGSVTLTDSATGTVIGNAPLAANGTVDITVHFDTAEDRTLTATYVPAVGFAPSSQQSGSITVAAATTTLNTSPVPATLAVGQPLVFVATATRTIPDSGPVGPGGIVVTINGVAQPREPTSAGATSISLDPAPGVYAIDLAFTSDGDTDAPSSTSFTFTVTAATSLALTVPTTPVTAGSNASYTAVLAFNGTGTAPSGTISFFDDGVILTSEPVGSGTVSVTVPAGTPGIHAITASYSGDAVHGASNLAAASYTVTPLAPVQAATSVAVVASSTTPQVGGAVTLSATVSTGTAQIPSGIVRFIDTGTNMELGRATLDGTGLGRVTVAITDTAALTVQAQYDGDATSAPSASTVTLSPVAATTITTLAVTPMTVVLGNTATLTATVARQVGGLPNAGIVTFLADGVPFATRPLVGGSATATSESINTTTIFTASFAPDNGTDLPSTSSSVTVNTSRAAATAAILINGNPDGSRTVTVALTAPQGVTRVPTGEVSLAISGQATRTANLVYGAASFDFPSGTLSGQVTFTASYPGDTAFTPATASRIYDAVLLQAAITPPTITDLPNGQVSLSATVTGAGALPTGDVVFTFANDPSNPVTGQLSGGTVTVILTRPTTTDTLLVQYLGDGVYGTAETSLTLAPLSLPTTTTVVASNPTPIIGEVVTLTATVSTGTNLVPTGTVRFLDGATLVGTGTLTGGTVSSTVTIANLQPITITAQYQGDVGSAQSSGQVTIAPTLAQPILTIGVNGAANDGVDVTITITPPSGSTLSPSGTVSISAGGAPTQVPVNNGEATINYPAGTLVGTVTFTATYSGDSAFAGATQTQTYNAGLLPSSISVNQGATPPNGPIPLTATIVSSGAGPAPSGTVTFTLASNPLVTTTETLDGSGQATTSFPRPTQSGSVIVSYSGDATHSPASIVITLTVPAPPAATSTALTASATSVFVGDTVILTANVTRTAGGTPLGGNVAFVANGTVLATVPVDGTGMAQTTSPALTANTVFTANYLPTQDNTDLGSTSSNLTVQVTRASVTTGFAINTDPNGNLVVTVSIVPPAGASQQPGGTVTLRATPPGTEITVPVVNGQAVISFPPGALNGTVTFNAIYSGDTNYAGAQGSQQYTVAPLAATLSATAGATAPDGTTPLTATVTPISAGATPTGTVTFTLASDPSVTQTVPLASGSAAVIFAAVPGGSLVTVHYSGDSSYGVLDTSITLGQGPALPTQLTLQPSQTSVTLGTPVTILASVNATASVTSGTVTIFANGRRFRPGKQRCCTDHADQSAAGREHHHRPIPGQRIVWRQHSDAGDNYRDPCGTTGGQPPDHDVGGPPGDLCCGPDHQRDHNRHCTRRQCRKPQRDVTWAGHHLPTDNPSGRSDPDLRRQLHRYRQ